MLFTAKEFTTFDPIRSLVIVLMFAAVLPLASSAQTQNVKKLAKESVKLTRAGSAEQGESLLRRALEIEPDNASLKVELALNLLKQRRIQESFDLAYKVAEADPRNARALAVVGNALMTAGRFADARAILFQAIKVDRKEDLAWAGYGMLDFYENKIGESIENLKEALYHEPREPDYVFALAQVCARSERYKDASFYYRKFLDVADTHDKDRRERIKGLIQFLDFLGNVGGLYTTAGSESTVLPFRMERDRPVITVRVNGRPDELNFVLDTGSGISVLSQEAAERLRIKSVARGGYARGIGGDGRFEIVYGHLKEVALGDVTLKNVPVYIRKFHSDGGGVNIDGYVGLSLISKFLATVDYGTQTFSLTRRDIDRSSFAAAKFASMPLRLTSSGFLSGEVQIEGVESPMNFIVDTGASVSVISRDVSRVTAISRYADGEKLSVIGSAGVTDDVPTFLLPRVSFGAHSIESLKAIALNLDIINEAAGFEQAGILGGNFLKNYRVTFDFRSSKVVFVPLNGRE